MESNLPATRPDDAGETVRPPLERRQPLSVAFLPLALVIAAWTFLAAAT